MRDLSRVLVSLTVGASLLAAPLTVAAAPAVDPQQTRDAPPVESDAPPVDTDELPLASDAPPIDTDELPLDTDELPLDRDEPPVESDELPLDTDELPLDTDELPLDTDELPLDSDDEPPLDSDEPPLLPLPLGSDEHPLDTDSDEHPLDTDSDEPPRPTLEDEFDTDDGGAIDDSYDPTRDSPEAQTARRWFAAGIAATVTGAVLVGGATALAMTAPCDPLAGNNCFVEARDRAAVTMGVPGGVLLLGGVAMTILGSVQKRKIARGITAGVSGSRDQFGVSVSGRF